MSLRETDRLSVLRECAERLARAEGEKVQSATEPFVAFLAGGHCFGVHLRSVVYAGRVRHLTPLPGGSSYLLGITVLAGHLVSMLDVAAFLELRQQGLSDVSCCLVVQANGRELGLAAEQLIGIEEVPADRIASLGTGGKTAIIKQAAVLYRTRMLLIDLEQLIADERLSGGGANHG